MAQPVSGYNWTKISGTAAGTTNVVDSFSGNLHAVVIPANKTGTASFYDAGTSAGTSATAHMFDLPNTVGSIPTVLPINANFNDGLIVVVGGTTDFTVLWA